jgi:hypothetical protein
MRGSPELPSSPNFPPPAKSSTLFTILPRNPVPLSDMSTDASDGELDLFQEPADYFQPEKQATFASHQLLSGVELSIRLVGHNPLWVRPSLLGIKCQHPSASVIPVSILLPSFMSNKRQDSTHLDHQMPPVFHHDANLQRVTISGMPGEPSQHILKSVLASLSKARMYSS